MPLPPEVKKTIRSLDKKIRELENLKRSLLELFGGSAPAAVVQEQHPIGVRISQVDSPRAVAAQTLQRMEEFLRSHGPATTAEVVTAASIPRGSISWLISKSGGRIRRREDAKLELAG
jgi:hypothetical protein